MALEFIDVKSIPAPTIGKPSKYAAGDNAVLAKLASAPPGHAVALTYPDIGSTPDKFAHHMARIREKAKKAHPDKKVSTRILDRNPEGAVRMAIFFDA